MQCSSRRRSSGWLPDRSFRMASWWAFFGVDNPDPDMMGLIASLLKMIGYFVISLLRRRDLLKHLNTLSFHDPLTGAYNHNALFEQNTFADKCKTMGVIYCDITGLK